MLFNSTAFLVFFGAFLLGAFAVRRSLAARTALIVGGSYLFYAWWYWPHALLLLAISLFAFLLALGLERIGSPRARRVVLAVGIALSLAPLVVVKYGGFARESVTALLGTLGRDVNLGRWEWLLPVGISFYTFQALGYVIDVYRGEVRATRNLPRFLAFVAFFPQLVAGPIERASRLLAQMERPRCVHAAAVESGLWLILWGLFKKVVIADNAAPLVELVFGHRAPGAPLILLGTAAFALQIYGDFSGYTDIARGAARLLGFELMPNFHLPYFATSLRDFWSRWHISLSTWLRDYLYIPLGGNRRGESRTYANLLLTMLLGGLWHGAGVNFLLWGLWHGAGLVVQHAWQRHRPPTRELPGWLTTPLTLAFVGYGWLLFRATSPGQVFELTARLTDFSAPDWWPMLAGQVALLAAPLFALEAWLHRRDDPEAVVKLPVWTKAFLQAAVLFLVAAGWEREPSPFIYFQF